MCRQGNKVKKCKLNSGTSTLARRDADAVADSSAAQELIRWLIAKNGRRTSALQ